MRQTMFQSTRPVRGATPCSSPSSSIRRCFNPRAPCGARPLSGSSRSADILFQSTRPVRGATAKIGIVRCASGGFNPRAPCGARHGTPFAGFRGGRVSIHAPRAGRDWVRHYDCRSQGKFQSTRPVRGATSSALISLPDASFQSTRPVRGATSSTCSTAWKRNCFNPRAPCGARLF